MGSASDRMRVDHQRWPDDGARGLVRLWMLGSGHHSSSCFSVKILIEKLSAELRERSAVFENQAFALLSCIHACVHHRGDVTPTESVPFRSRSSCWQVSLMNK